MLAETTVDAVLSLRSVSIAAGGLSLLHGVDLELRAGELVALVGPSGSGKTSLLRAVSALDDPTAGSIAFDGRSAHEWGEPEYRRRVLYVAQRPAMLPGTARDNLAAAFEYHASAQCFPEAHARELAARLVLGERVLEQDARDLSEGERQRVALVRALLLEPAVLLLDEPTSALDPKATAATEEVVREMATRGLAALVVTHSPEQAQRWCDRSVNLAEWVPGGRQHG